MKPDRDRVCAGASGRAGFSLIELLTVIAIIGILAMILVPVVMSVRASAHAATCVSNLREVGSAVHLWSDENQGRLPPVSVNADADRGRSFYRWHMDLPLYAMNVSSLEDLYFSRAGSANVFVCVAAYNRHAASDGFLGERQGYTYGMSHITHGGIHTVTDGSLPVDRPLSDVRTPSQTALFMDGTYAPQAGHWVNEIHHSPEHAHYPEFAIHSGAINVLYVDGHVGRVSEAAFPEALDDPFWDDPREW